MPTPPKLPAVLAWDPHLWERVRLAREGRTSWRVLAENITQESGLPFSHETLRRWAHRHGIR